MAIKKIIIGLVAISSAAVISWFGGEAVRNGFDGKKEDTTNDENTNGEDNKEDDKDSDEG